MNISDLKLNMKLAGRLVLLVFSIHLTNVSAQDSSGMFGDWEMTGRGPSDKEDCGEKYVAGTLSVYQRVTNKDNEIYQGVLRFEESHQGCEDVDRYQAYPFLTIIGENVFVGHSVINTGFDHLVRSGSLMEGEHQNGFKTQWRKIGPPSEDKRAAEVRQALIDRDLLKEGEFLRRNAISNGYNEVDAELWVVEFAEGTADCAVNNLRAVAAEQGLSFYELLSFLDPDPHVGLLNVDLFEAFNHREFTSRFESCVSKLNDRDQRIGR